ASLSARLAQSGPPAALGGVRLPCRAAELPVISGDKSNLTVANASVSRRGAHDRRNCAEQLGGPACSFAPAIWQTVCMAPGSQKYLHCPSKRPAAKPAKSSVNHVTRSGT